MTDEEIVKELDDIQQALSDVAEEFKMAKDLFIIFKSQCENRTVELGIELENRRNRRHYEN